MRLPKRVRVRFIEIPAVLGIATQRHHAPSTRELVQPHPVQVVAYLREVLAIKVCRYVYPLDKDFIPLNVRYGYQLRFR